MHTGHPRHRHHLGKPMLTLGFCAALLLASTVEASGGESRHFRGDRQQYTTWARVIDVEPVYRRVAVEEPQRECWIEDVPPRHQGYRDEPYRHRQTARRHHTDAGDSSLAGAVIGGVIGNRVGHHFGGSHGERVVGTIAGAVIGSTIASDRAEARSDDRRRQGTVESATVEHCREFRETRYVREIDHYRVSYRLDGHVYTTRSQRHPGQRIAVDVSVRPRPGHHHQPGRYPHRH